MSHPCGWLCQSFGHTGTCGDLDSGGNPATGNGTIQFTLWVAEEVTSARSQDTFQRTLPSSQALGLRLDLITLSHLAVSEHRLEAIQVPSCLASWLWFTKYGLGKEGRDRGVLAGAFPWVETGRTLGYKAVSESLVSSWETPSWSSGWAWPPLPLRRGTPRVVTSATLY